MLRAEKHTNWLSNTKWSHLEARITLYRSSRSYLGKHVITINEEKSGYEFEEDKEML